VSSTLELELASRMKAADIIYSSPVKTQDEIDLAARASATIMVNARDELPKVKSALDSARDSSRIGLRLSLGRGGTEWSRFGIRSEGVGGVVEDMSRLGLRLSGLHFHLGSWLRYPAPYVKALEKVGGLLSDGPLASVAEGLEFVDIGGGIGVSGSSHKDVLDYARGFMSKHGVGGYIPHKPLMSRTQDSMESFAEAICGSFERDILPAAPDAVLWLEPGRLLAAPSFHLVVSVLAVRDSGVVVDGGINLLPSALHEKYRVVNLSKPLVRRANVNVWGPLPMSNDKIADGVLGGPPGVGDILCVMDVGAYNISMSPQFVQPQAAIVSVNGGVSRLVRRREDLSHRLGRDVLD